MSGIPMYLGGPSREHQRVRAWVNALEALGGLEFTNRWFDHAERFAGRDALLSTVQQELEAGSCLQGIRYARIVWLLWPADEVSLGTASELGYALASRWHFPRGRLRLVVSGPKVRESIFTSRADFRCEDDPTAYELVKAWATRLRGEARPA